MLAPSHLRFSSETSPQKIYSGFPSQNYNNSPGNTTKPRNNSLYQNISNESHPTKPSQSRYVILHNSPLSLAITPIAVAPIPPPPTTTTTPTSSTTTPTSHSTISTPTRPKSASTTTTTPQQIRIPPSPPLLDPLPTSTAFLSNGAKAYRVSNVVPHDYSDPLITGDRAVPSISATLPAPKCHLQVKHHHHRRSMKRHTLPPIHMEGSMAYYRDKDKENRRVHKHYSEGRLKMGITEFIPESLVPLTNYGRSLVLDLDGTVLAMKKVPRNDPYIDILRQEYGFLPLNSLTYKLSNSFELTPICFSFSGCYCILRFRRYLYLFFKLLSNRWNLCIASHGNQKYVNSIVEFFIRIIKLNFVSVTFRDDKVSKNEKDKPKTFDGPLPLILDDRPCVWEEQYLPFVKEVPALRYETAENDYVLLDFIVLSLKQSLSDEDVERLGNLFRGCLLQKTIDIILTYLPSREQLLLLIKENMVSQVLQDLEEAEHPLPLYLCANCQQVSRGHLGSVVCVTCLKALSVQRVDRRILATLQPDSPPSDVSRSLDSPPSLIVSNKKKYPLSSSFTPPLSSTPSMPSNPPPPIPPNNHTQRSPSTKQYNHYSSSRSLPPSPHPSTSTSSPNHSTQSYSPSLFFPTSASHPPPSSMHHTQQTHATILTPNSPATTKAMFVFPKQTSTEISYISHVLSAMTPPSSSSSITKKITSSSTTISPPLTPNTPTYQVISNPSRYITSPSSPTSTTTTTPTTNGNHYHNGTNTKMSPHWSSSSPTATSTSTSSPTASTASPSSRGVGGTTRQRMKGRFMFSPGATRQSERVIM